MSAQQHPDRFASLLRRHRREAGLTQEALAERAGVAWRTVSDLERGVKLPRRDTLALLAEALALTGARRAAFEAAALRRATVPSAEAITATGARTWSPFAATPAPLVGRAHELALLERHLAGEGPPLLLLAGQPGIGKSRLLQEAARRAGGRGWRVLVGGCTRSGGQQPFAPLLQALQRHLGGRSPDDRRHDLRGCLWLIRLLPELPEDEIEPLPGWTLPPEQERRLMFDAVRRFLTNVAGGAGTLLLLDDLQWAGSDALELLVSLLQHGSCRVVGAFRDTDVGPEHPLSATIAEVAEAQLALMHPLQPLAHQEAEELFAQLLGDRARTVPVSAAQVAQRAGGVPFFLVSYARDLGREHGDEPTPPGVPWDLRQSIQRRVAALPEAARPLLSAAAVVGRVTPLPLLLALAVQPEQLVLDALERACRAGLLEEVGEDAYGFVHDVIREVVEGDLGLARRRLLHRQVAEALEHMPGEAPVEALAYHFRHGGEPARAAGYLEQAGDRAEAQYAHAAAAAHYRDMVSCLEGSGQVSDLVRASEKLARALENMAQYDAELAVLERAAEALRAGIDTEVWGRIEAWIAGVHSARGTIPAATARLRPVVASLESGGPSTALAHAYMMLAALCYGTGQPERALLPSDRAWDIACTLGDRRLQVDVAVNRGFSFMFLNRADEAVQVIEEALELVERLGQPLTLLFVLSSAAWFYEERGEYTQGRSAAERALALADQLRIAERMVWCRVRLGVCDFLLGDWPRARAYFEEAMALARQMGFTQGHGYAVPRVDFARLCLAEGQWDEATSLLEEVLAIFAETGERIVRLVAHSQLAERDILAGNPAAARARLLPLLDQPGREERVVTQFILPALAWAQLEAGGIDQAAAIAADAVRRGRAGQCRYGLAHALRVAALIAVERGQWIEAEHVLEEGLTLVRSMPYPHGEGRLLHVAGRLRARMGEQAQARDRLDAALAIFRRLGARSDIGRVEQDCAALR